MYSVLLRAWHFTAEWHFVSDFSLNDWSLPILLFEGEKVANAVGRDL